MNRTNAISRAAVERIAENRIREAIATGEMDGLPGLGRPIPGIDEPYDPRRKPPAWTRGAPVP
jgi:hypothetical protein